MLTYQYGTITNANLQIQQLLIRNTNNSFSATTTDIDD